MVSMSASLNLRRKPLQIINKRLQLYREHANSVSLGKLYEILDMEPTPLQSAMVELFDNRLEDWNELNIAASRRFGKTMSASILAVRELLLVNSSTICISKSSKSVGVLFNEILRLLRVLGIRPTKVNSNNYTLQVNESYFKATPFKTMDTLLGNFATLIIADESGVYAAEEEMAINLLPMRNDAGSYENTGMFVAKTVRISSPRSLGSDFYYVMLKGYEDKPKELGLKDIYISPKGYCSLTYSIYDSPLVSPELIESLKQTTDGDVWKTEYLAKFINMGAASAFDRFNQGDNTFNLEELTKRIGGTSLESLGFNFESMSESSPRLQGFLGIDIGWRDSSSVIVGTVIDNKIYVLDAFASPYLTTKELAGEIQNIITKWSSLPLPLDFSNGAIYIDKTAALTSADLNNTYDIPAMPGYNKVKEGISLINAGFKTKKVYINEALGDLVDEIETLSYKENIVGALSKTSGDPFVRLKGKGHHDRVHAMRYMVTSIMMYWGYATEASELDYEA